MSRPRILYCFPEAAGELFEPSNGTEGAIFVHSFCDNCLHQNPDPDGEKQCDILMRSLAYSTIDKEYPTEWIFDKDGWPTCSKWVKWDWENDGDPDDPNNPNPVPIISNDPNQLCAFPPDEVKEIFTEESKVKL